MKNTKKTVKGMTLIEIIISLFVFTVTAAIMVMAGSTTQNLLRNSNHLNNKRNAEAPAAAVRDVNAVEQAASEVMVVSEVSASETTYVPMEVETVRVEFNVEIGGKTAANSIKTTRYSTASLGAKAAANGSNTNSNMQGDLDFYVIDTTEATT